MSKADLKKPDPESHTLVCMMGLPYAGKSMWAHELVRSLGMPMVCPDAIRRGLHGERFIAEAEDMVWAIAHTMVRSLFLAGHPLVLLDACNGTVKRRKAWWSTQWQTFFRHIDTPYDVCYERALQFNDLEILPSLQRMSEQFEPLGPSEAPWTDALIKAKRLEPLR